jgi:simple sugar transport system permease protein
MNKVRRLLTGGGGMNALSSILAIAAGLIAGFIILLFSNPSKALRGFALILSGGFSDMFNLGQVLYYSTPIIMTGLSVGFAGKTGLFNIGASGQFTAGMYASILCAIKLSFLPPHLLVIAALLAGVLGGALWGLIPGILKALCNVNEVIACIMMNYIGMYLVNHLIKVTGIYDQLRNMTIRVPGAANLPKIGLEKLFSTVIPQGGIRPSSVGSGIIIAIFVCIIFYVVLERTKFGYELKACGFNREAARYAGINENRGIILSMVFAGAMAGLGGALLALAGAGRGVAVVDTLANEGFQGIPVALLGLFNPIGIVFSGFLVAYLTQSGFLLQSLDFAPEVIEIIISVIIYFAALALLLKSVVQRIFRDRKGSPPGSPDDAAFDNASAQEGNGVL